MFKITNWDHLLKAGVVPGVLEDFHVKRVLDFSSTARAVTIFCTERKEARLCFKLGALQKIRPALTN